MADRKNISVVRANAAGALALYYSFINDEVRAETFAQEAVQYGDTWENGQKVLDDIKRAQQERQCREEEARRHREEENRRAEESRTNMRSRSKNKKDKKENMRSR